jgi:hypothetical protein
MTRYDWSGELGRIRCRTLVVVPGAEAVGSTANHEPFRRHVRDVDMRVYDGMPHNIGDAFPDRCAADVLDFRGRRFSRQVIDPSETAGGATTAPPACGPNTAPITGRDHVT